MKIGRVSSKQIFDENRVFNGTDVKAEFVDAKGRIAEVTFRYAFATLDALGQVQRVVQSLKDDKPTPTNISDVRVN